MTTVPSASDFPGVARFYRNHLIDNVMAFWDRHSPDREHGGYLHQLDRQGNLTGTDKNVWCQGRMTYMYAALYRQIEPRPQWLQFARLGRDFLVNRCYAGEGRWHYKLNRAGTEVLVKDRSLFGDAFALMGLCEYATASGSDEDLPIIRATFDAIERNLTTPGFNEYHHFSLDPSLRWHSPNMIAVGLSEMVTPVLGRQRVKSLLDRALDQILHVFVKDEHRVLFEVLNADGTVLHDARGQSVNPGHSLESLWFCLEEGIRRNDQGVIDRAAQAMDWAYVNGLDREFGGILNTTSPAGGKPPGPEVGAWGERWDYKVWWVHSESLYALALAAVETNNPTQLERFGALHDYTFRHFPDPEFGEWYEYLTREGQPVYYDKAKWIKSAFHIPRNLMKLTLLLERAGKQG